MRRILNASEVITLLFLVCSNGVLLAQNKITVPLQFNNVIEINSIPLDFSILNSMDFYSGTSDTLQKAPGNNILYSESFDSGMNTPEDFGFTLSFTGDVSGFKVGFLTKDDGKIWALPYSGKAYLYSLHDKDNPKDEWAITPAVELKENTKYNFSVWICAPGWQGVNEEFKICMGVTPSVEGMTKVLLDKTGENTISTEEKQWINIDVDFIPEYSGKHYFGIHHCTSAVDVNAIAFDDIVVKEVLTVLPLVADFEISHSEIEFGGIIGLVDKSDGVIDYCEWQPYLPENEISFITEPGDRYFMYSGSGIFDIALTVCNETYEDTKIIRNAVKVDEKAYHNYPYILNQENFDNPFSRGSFIGWNYYSIGDDKFLATDYDDVLISKWFYLDKDYDYYLNCEFGVYGSAYISVGLMKVEEADRVGLVKYIDGYYFNKGNGQYKELLSPVFSVEENENYVLVFIPASYEPYGELEHSFIRMASFKLVQVDRIPTGLPVESFSVNNVSILDNNTIQLKNLDKVPVTLISVDGKIVYNRVCNSSCDITVSHSGLYFLKLGEKVIKLWVR